MGVYVHDGPVNPAQVIAALGVLGAAVREVEAGWEVEVDDVAAEAIEAAVAGIVFDETVGAPQAQTVEELQAEFAAYKANVQAAMAQRDAGDLARDEWLLDLAIQIMDLQG